LEAGQIRGTNKWQRLQGAQPQVCCNGANLSALSFAKLTAQESSSTHDFIHIPTTMPEKYAGIDVYIEQARGELHNRGKLNIAAEF